MALSSTPQPTDPGLAARPSALGKLRPTCAPCPAGAALYDAHGPDRKGHVRQTRCTLREIVRGHLTAVRPATDDDVDRLVAWHADPDVSRYWDDETFTREQMLERLRRSDVESYIVEVDGGAVGYLQMWTDDGRSGGIDMFLVPSARGRGFGPDAGRAAARYLRAERGWSRVTVDPYRWNEQAVRAWTRAGFVAVGEGEPDDEHSAAWLLMEFRE